MNQVKLDTIAKLKTLPVCKPNGDETWWTVRCPFCGDSRTETHGHLAIKIDVNDNSSMGYHCLKCPASGSVNSEFLELLGTTLSSDDISNINSFNKNSSKRILKHGKRVLDIPLAKDTSDNRNKVFYFNKRLGTNYTYEDFKKFNMVLNLSDFLDLNKIVLDKSIHTIKELDRHYIGFLSNNNNKIIFRDITNNSFLDRYYNITLNKDDKSDNTFYALISQFDLLYTDTIDVHIAEGTFDIHSIYHNFANKEVINQIYLAVGGFKYSKIIKYLFSRGITTNIHLHIWADNDKKDNDHKFILNNSEWISKWISKITIHRNYYNGEKDFGVSIDKIDHNFYTIKLK